MFVERATSQLYARAREQYALNKGDGYGKYFGGRWEGLHHIKHTFIRSQDVARVTVVHVGPREDPASVARCAEIHKG